MKHSREGRGGGGLCYSLTLIGPPDFVTNCSCTRFKYINFKDSRNSRLTQFHSFGQKIRFSSPPSDPQSESRLHYFHFATTQQEIQHFCNSNENKAQAIVNLHNIYPLLLYGRHLFWQMAQSDWLLTGRIIYAIFIALLRGGDENRVLNSQKCLKLVQKH